MANDESSKQGGSTYFEKLMTVSQELSRAKCLSAKQQSHFNIHFDRQIRVSDNFSRVLLDKTVACDNYLRPADVIITIADGKNSAKPGCARYTLLSGHEGNRTLPMFWEYCCKASGVGPVVRDVSFSHYPSMASCSTLTIRSSASSMNCALVDYPEQRESVRVQLRLFMGECKYEGRDALVLRRLLGVVTTADVRELLRSGSSSTSSSMVVDSDDADVATTIIEWMRDRGVTSRVGKIIVRAEALDGVDLEDLDVPGPSKGALIRLLKEISASCVVEGIKFGEACKLIATNLRGHAGDFELSDLQRASMGIE